MLKATECAISQLQGPKSEIKESAALGSPGNPPPPVLSPPSQVISLSLRHPLRMAGRLGEGPTPQQSDLVIIVTSALSLFLNKAKF